MDVLICLPFELSCWSSLTKGGDFEASIYNVDQSEC